MIWGRFRVDFGSIWGRFGVGLGSIWGRFGRVGGKFGVFAQTSSGKAVSGKVAPRNVEFELKTYRGKKSLFSAGALAHYPRLHTDFLFWHFLHFLEIPEIVLAFLIMCRLCSKRSNRAKKMYGKGRAHKAVFSAPIGRN